MSVKHKYYVQSYVRHKQDILLMLDQIRERVLGMPEPDSNGELPSLHYGHTGAVGDMCKRIAEAADIAVNIYG